MSEWVSGSAILTMCDANAVWNILHLATNTFLFPFNDRINESFWLALQRFVECGWIMEFHFHKTMFKKGTYISIPQLQMNEKKIKRYAISFACSILIELNWMLSYAFELCWTFPFVSFSPININWACDSNFLTNANFPFKFHRFAMLLTEICPQI